MIASGKTVSPKGDTESGTLCRVYSRRMSAVTVMRTTSNVSEDDPSLRSQVWPPWIVQVVLASICLSLLMFSFADFRRRRHKQLQAKLHRLSKKRRFHMLTQEYIKKTLGSAAAASYDLVNSSSTDDPMQVSTCTHISSVSADYETASCSTPRPSCSTSRPTICRYDLPLPPLQHDSYTAGSYDHDSYNLAPPSPIMDGFGSRRQVVAQGGQSRSFLMMNFRRQQTNVRKTTVCSHSSVSQSMQMSSFPDYF